MALNRRRKPRPSAQLLALLAAAVPAAGMAQTAPATNTTLPTVTVKETAEIPYKAEKSANEKFTAPLLDTPKTIQIIKKEVIQEQGAVTLMEALRNTPGITMQMGENGNSTAGDAFQLRGFSLQESIFVDGIRDLGTVTRDTFNLEQVEVFKGTAGAETGRGAASGFINLVSKQAHLGDESSGSVVVGTGSKKRATVDLNRQLSSDSAFRLNAMVQDSGVDGRDEVNNKGYGLALSYVDGLDTPTRLHLYSQHIRQNNVPDGGIPAIGYPGYTTAIGPKVRRENFYGSVNDREKVDADMFTAKIEHDLGEGTTVRNITRLGQTHMKRVLTGVNTGATGITTVGPQSDWTVNRSRQRVDQENSIIANQTSVNKTFNAGGLEHSLAAGVELLREQQKALGFSTTGLTIPPANLYNPNPFDNLPEPYASGASNAGSTTTLGLYVFDNVKLDEQWSVNGGLRLDRYKLRTRNFSATGVFTDLDDSRTLTSWSLGGVYKPAANGSIYTSVGTSSLPPGGANFQLSATANNQANAALDPQKTSSVELGTKWELIDKRLNVAAAVFRTVNDKQTTIDPITNASVQEGKTQVQGIELSAVGQITRLWQVTAGLAKTSTKQIDQRSATAVTDAVRWSPDLTLTLWNSYQLDQWTLGLGARYVSEQKRVITVGGTGNVPNVPSYFVADAMVAYRISDAVNLQLNVYNLFDREYLMALNNGGGRLALGAPRSATLTANFKF